MLTNPLVFTVKCDFAHPICTRCKAAGGNNYMLWNNCYLFCGITEMIGFLLL
jgi:hypothetical protein